MAGYFGLSTVLVAHDLGLFELLGEGACSPEEICERLDLAPRPVRTMLTVCASLDFIERRDERWGLTEMGEDYFLAASPTYVGGSLRIMANDFGMGSYENVRQAIVADRPQVQVAAETEGEDWAKSLEEQAAWAQAFTRSMHSISMAPASAWPGILDLSEHRVFLDVGGGSGAHSITAAAKWPELEAIVLDLPFVCEVAEELVAAAGLDGRIRTHPADMWRAPFPPADVHFYSQIFHDHPPSRCRTLARKSFDSLSPGGRIVVHEMLLDEDETGPFAVATIGVAMLLLTQGQQFTAPQLHALLEEVGFEGVEVVPTFGHWQLVTGRKPW
jgi:precorrin-6B methylase 2